VLAYAIAAVSPTMDIANAALPAYVTSLLFFVGLLLRVQDQPAYWKWCARGARPRRPARPAAARAGLCSVRCLLWCTAFQWAKWCVVQCVSVGPVVLCSCGPHALALTRRRRARRYGYLDFLRYAWGAQMCNQFEGQTTVVLDQQTVRPPPAPRWPALPPGWRLLL